MPIQMISYQKKPKVEQPKESFWGKVLTGVGAAAGGIAGGIAGGPAGAIAGASGGAGLGGLVGGMADPAKAGSVQERANAASSLQQGDSISRRLAQQQSQNMATLKQAQAALDVLPKSIREQYGPTIADAIAQEEQRKARGMA